MTETGRRNFPKRMHMRIYLYRGCDGLRQYIQMMKWIHHLGVEEAYRIVRDLFDDAWETSIEELVLCQDFGQLKYKNFQFLV